jgi:hypothetical protein
MEKERKKNFNGGCKDNNIITLMFSNLFANLLFFTDKACESTSWQSLSFTIEADQLVCLTKASEKCK